MKLDRLFELHLRSSSPGSLTDNFGDGYLLKNNRIYEKIRSASITAGYAFSSAPDVGYAALPFAQLETILASRKIPYVNNVSVIEQLVEKLRDNVAWDDISDGLRKNYVFHEACHAVARTIPRRKGETRAFRMMMEESFANTCELLAVADAEDANHRVFFELNSYTALFEEKTNIKNAIRASGFPAVFRIVWLAYLFSNFLHEQLEEKNWRQCLAIAEADTLPAPQIKALKALSRIAFTLDARFREVTTRFHLKLNGVAMTSQEVRATDVLLNAGLSEFLTSALRSLGQIA